MRRIPADLSHGGIRLVVLLAFIGGLVGGYLLTNALIPSEGISILAFFGGLLVAWALSQLLETLFTGRWHSGRHLELLVDGVRLSQRQQVQAEIRGDAPMQVLMWRFKVQKRSRVPRGWYMLACALEQDDTYVPVYTFVSPEDFERLPQREYFMALVSKKQTKTAGVDRDLALTGQQRRLHVAEQHRWMDGAEISADDFAGFLTWLQDTFPRWMPARA